MSEEGNNNQAPKRGKGLLNGAQDDEEEEEGERKPAAQASEAQAEEDEDELSALKARERAIQLSLGFDALTTSHGNSTLTAPPSNSTTAKKIRTISANGGGGGGLLGIRSDMSAAKNHATKEKEKEEDWRVIKAREKAIQLSLEFSNNSPDELQQQRSGNSPLGRALLVGEGIGISEVKEEDEGAVEAAVGGGVAAALLGTGGCPPRGRAPYPSQQNVDKEGGGKHKKQKEGSGFSASATALTTDISGQYAGVSRLPGGAYSSLPGAYSGTPGAGLERRSNIRKSLVGTTMTTAPMVMEQQDDDDDEEEEEQEQQPSSSTLSRAVLNENNNSNNDNNNHQDEYTNNDPSTHSRQQQRQQQPQDDYNRGSNTTAETTISLAQHQIDNLDEEDIERLGLAEARPVSGDSTLNIVAEPVDPNKASTIRKRANRCRILLGLGLLILLIFVVVAAFVGWKIGTRNDEGSATSSSSSSSSTSSATDLSSGATVTTSPPTASPTGLLELLLESLPASSLENVNTFDTPQFWALNWLEHHPNLFEMEEWQKRQLFALATFFYGMEGPDWPAPIRNKWLDYEMDECYWFSTGFGKFNFATGLWQEDESHHFNDDGNNNNADDDNFMDPCNEDGEFQLLHLVGLDLGDKNNPHLPEEIALLTSLKVLSLNASYITTPLADFLPTQLYHNMTNLKTLVLGENHLNGTIRSQFGLLTNLSNLFLNSNDLTGGLPTELGLLTSLHTIDLDLNHLTGSIPLELTYLSGLVQMLFWGNYLSGSIPSEIATMTNLTMIGLDTNHLTGTIPPSLAAMPNLSQIWLYSNLLTGEIPSELGNLVSNGVLVQLQLELNSLTGTVADSICNIAINSTDWYTRPISFDCNTELCGCCWCPCNAGEGGTNNISAAVDDCHLSPPGPFDPSTTDEDWPGSFPTPLNSSNLVTINIRTDEYPEEVSWQWSVFVAQTGTWDTLDSVEQLLEPEMLFSYTMDVRSDTTYRLRLSDALGDGSCCDYGFGWYSITTAAPSSDHMEGTVIWNATGEVLWKTLDLILRIDSDGLPELVDSIEEQ